VKRIGLVTTSYPRRAGDPAGGFVAGHARWLASRGLEVEVVAAGDDGATERDGRITIVRVPDKGRLFYRGGAPETFDDRVVRATIAGARFTAGLAAAVRARARTWDGAVCHWLAPSAIVAAPLTRGPLLAIAHSGDVHVLARRGLLAPTLAALLARGARLVFVSDELLAIARDAVPRVLRGRLDAAALVYPMGLDLARFTAIAAARATRPRATPARIGVIGRLVPVKGIEVLLDALASVTAPVELVIAGDGPSRVALEARVLPTRHRARFLGEVPADRRDAVLGGLDLLVAPSIVLDDGRTEGTPTAVLEAVAAAVPVIASTAGGLASLPGPWARRVPAGDPRALAAAITAALADPDLQLLANATAASARVLDWNVVGRRLHDHWLGHAA